MNNLWKPVIYIYIDLLCIYIYIYYINFTFEVFSSVTQLMPVVILYMVLT